MNDRACRQNTETNRRGKAGLCAILCAALATAGLLGGCESVSQAILPDQNTLHVGISRPFGGNFCPLSVQSTEDAWITDLVFESMLVYDADMNLTPSLAAQMPYVDKDGKSIIWTLRPDMTFSDGTTLDGSDVRYTFELLADPDAIRSSQEGMFDFIEGWKEYRDGLADDISGITVSDDGLHVRFVCETPDIDAVTLIGSVCILSDEQVDYVKGSLDPYRGMAPEDLIGSGPYVIDRYDPKEGVHLSLNPSYTGAGDYSIDSIAVGVVKAERQVQALENGEIDLIPGQNSIQVLEQAAAAAKDNPDLIMESALRPGMFYIGLNTQSGPSADVKVRQALAYALDADAFLDGLFDEDGPDVQRDLKALCALYVPQTFWTPIAPNAGEIVQGKKTLENLQTYRWNLEKARALLDEAGWKPGEDGIRTKNGKPLEIRFLASKNNDILRRLFLYLEISWKAIGVDLKTNTVSFASLIETIAISNDATLGDWNAFFLSIGFTDRSSAWMNAVEGCTQSGGEIRPNSSNYARLCDDTLNTLLQQGKHTTDADRSFELYEKAMVRAADLCAYIPVYGGNTVTLHTSRLQNLKIGPLCPWSRALNGAVLLSEDESAVHKWQTSSQSSSSKD